MLRDLDGFRIKHRSIPGDALQTPLKVTEGINGGIDFEASDGTTATLWLDTSTGEVKVTHDGVDIVLGG